MKIKAKKKPVDNQIEVHLREKRNELIWALSLQDYTPAQIGRVFNVHRSTVKRIIEKKPRDWQPKWVKKTEEEAKNIRLKAIKKYFKPRLKKVQE